LSFNWASVFWGTGWGDLSVQGELAAKASTALRADRRGGGRKGAPPPPDPQGIDPHGPTWSHMVPQGIDPHGPTRTQQNNKNKTTNKNNKKQNKTKTRSPPSSLPSSFPAGPGSVVPAPASVFPAGPGSGLLCPHSFPGLCVPGPGDVSPAPRTGPRTARPPAPGGPARPPAGPLEPEGVKRKCAETDY